MGYSETPKLQPIVPNYHLRILSDEQLAELKSASWILENHHPEPLAEEQKSELKRILQTADHELS